MPISEYKQDADCLSNIIYTLIYKYENHTCLLLLKALASNTLPQQQFCCPPSHSLHTNTVFNLKLLILCTIVLLLPNGNKICLILNCFFPHCLHWEILPSGWYYHGYSYKCPPDNEPECKEMFIKINVSYLWFLHNILLIVPLQNNVGKKYLCCTAISHNCYVMAG